MIIVGIDIASMKHDYFMIQADTGVVFSGSSITVTNSEEGYKKLHGDIHAFCGATGDQEIRIGLESTGIYHTNIIAFLIAKGYQVMMINPILTNMVRKASKVHAPKNDNLDSQTICKYMIDNPDKFLPYTLSLYKFQTLKSICRKRFFIVDELRKAKIVVNNLVHIIFPEFKSLFSNIYGTSAISILKEYGTPKKLSRARRTKLEEMLHGRCKCSIDEILETAKHSVGISDECYAFELTDAIEEMEHIQHRVEKYDAQIKLLVDELCPNLLSVPGIGYTTAGLIAGEIGDIKRFHSAENLVSFSGLDVVVYESGKYKAKNLMPSKKGSRYLRYALFQVARIIWQHDPVYKAYYEKKQAEGKHYFVIMGHIEKKLCRLVFSLMNSGNSYELRS